jgi:four helix bundle protein
MKRESAKRFQDLLVWQKSHSFVLAIYRFSRGFPTHETYGLRAQLRRAAVSVPANIAEAFKRRTAADKARILNIAEASLEEARYYLLLAHELEYGDSTKLSEVGDEVGRMLFAYTRRVLES